MKPLLPYHLLPICLLAAMASAAQVSDNFTDGDFQANPAWTGNAADWKINADGQLQSNHTTPNSQFYLSVPNPITGAAQWDFWVRLAFNPSGANYADVYLAASQSNPGAAGNTGYFVRLGDTPDEVSLYRRDAGGGSVKIIDGTDGVLNSSNNLLRIRVLRDGAGKWTLWRDPGATGAYLAEGTANDTTYTGSSWFGIWIRQSTASFVQKHYFDDIVVKPFTPDLTPPSLQAVKPVSANLLEVIFDELPEPASLQNRQHYEVNNGLGHPGSVLTDPANPLKAILQFEKPFPNGLLCTLLVNGVSDAAGNRLVNGRATFLHYSPQRYDIVINELMIDPLPQVGLPNAGWVELLNTSNFTINLQGYRLARKSGISSPLPDYPLAAGQLVIVCPGTNTPLLAPFGPTVGVTSFPALPNSGELLWLQDGEGKIMHAVAYGAHWYQNEVKAAGGWSLEMIDAKNPCTGLGNWRASTHASGGTPGKPNSIAAANPDKTPPQLLDAFAPDSHTLLLNFSEPLDSAGAAVASGYRVGNGTGIQALASAETPLFDRVKLALNTPLQPGTIYTVSAAGQRDCSGNAATGEMTVRTGLAQPADSFDLVVNEILFNPKPQGTDYLEVYNRSNKLLDAGSIFLSNRGTNGNPGTPYPLSPVNRLIFPGEYYVVTENPALLRPEYTLMNPSAIAALPAMPSFPDDKGTALLLSQTGRIIDELNYDRRWHFALVGNDEGVALERIDFDKPTYLPENWTSAAASAGFGTPGYRNSQFRAGQQAPAGTVVVNPPMFSPDNDGFEDFCLVEFSLNEPGYVANITIFDAAGRPVRVLQRNATLAAGGTFRWDGLNDQYQRVPAGNYILLFEVFNLQGKKQAFKKGVTVARKF